MSMTQTAIFWPVIVQVALTYAIYALISRRRIAAIKAGDATVSQFRENQNEPPQSRFVRNSLENQFELPVLFFAASISAFVLDFADVAMIALAWVFVLSRVAHAWVHVTTNRIRHRRPAFVLGFLVLGAMWALIAWRLALS
jgi:hypothetical protein